MNYRELQEEIRELEAQIDTYYLFYQDFTIYDMNISVANGLLMEMYSNLIAAKKKNKDSKAVIDQEVRINKLLEILQSFCGLNNKSQSLKLRFKHLNQDMLAKDKQIENLKNELEAIKLAYEND